MHIMPIEVGIWKVENDHPKRLNYSAIQSEKKLETLLEKDTSILGEDVLIIGRQVVTEHGKSIDLLGMDRDGNLIIYELKKNQTPREVVAQAMDYASWVQTLTYEAVEELYEGNYKEPLEKGFAAQFQQQLPEELNTGHRMVIVCAELDHATERIINYLTENYNVPINALYFRYFVENDEEFLARTWLIDPHLPENALVSKAAKKKEPWNKRDFVVNFEDGAHRSWSDAVNFGFIAAGNGKWYSQTLNNLFLGARIFCMIPGKGYVGIGKVVKEAVPAKDAVVLLEGKEHRLLDCTLHNPNIGHDADDLEKCEYVVAIEWQKTVSIQKAFWTLGLRSNQNSAFKLRNQYTIDKVEEFFEI